MLEETLQICRQMWSDDNGPYQGKHYQLAETVCVPAPIQRPGPPVLIGGGGERKTLRLVAQYADIWNFTGATVSVDELAHKIDVLTRHCETVGRDPAEIRKTVALPDDPFTDDFLRTVEGFASLGIDLVNVGPPPGFPDPAGFVVRVGEQVVPRLAQIG